MYYRPYVILKYAHTQHILAIEEIFGGRHQSAKRANTHTDRATRSRLAPQTLYAHGENWAWRHGCGL